MYDLAPYLNKIDEVIAKGPFKDSWASLQNHQTPEWFKKAKFGIFIHWGIYSVPAFHNEWYSRNMYIQGTEEFEHHVKTYGPHKDFGYKDFIPMFKAENFDANEWARLFKEAGANYVVPVAEHHDGFQMYDSEISEWNAANMGPKRDVLGELKKAFLDNGLTLGASTHRIEHWFFMSHGKEFDSDIKEPMKRGDFYWPAMEEQDHYDIHSKPTPTKEYLDDWMVRTCEIIDKYQPLELYFDWWIHHESAKPYLKKIAAYYYNRAVEWGKEVTICYKHDAFLFGTALPDVERGQFADVKPYEWQTDTAIATNSWCYTEQNINKLPQDIVCDIVDIISKNGNVLLNVGPKADGTISQADVDVLQGIGRWMKSNGEAIYNTKIWRSFGEGPTKITEGQFSDGVKKVFTSGDFRFTTANGYLYATVLKADDNGDYCITKLGIADASKQANFHAIIKKVELLETHEELEWSRDEKGLHFHCEKKTEYPISFRITID